MSAAGGERTAFPAWWETRSRRERRLLGALAALILGLGLWYGVVAPIRAAERAAIEAHARAVERLATVGSAAREMAALQTVRGSTGGRPLAAVVVQSSLGAGVPVARQGLEGEGLAVGVDRADPAAFFRWIALLGRDHGVSVSAMEMTRNSDGTVRARVVFTGDAA